MSSRAFSNPLMQHPPTILGSSTSYRVCTDNLAGAPQKSLHSTYKSIKGIKAAVKSVSMVGNSTLEPLPWASVPRLHFAPVSTLVQGAIWLFSSSPLKQRLKGLPHVTSVLLGMRKIISSPQSWEQLGKCRSAAGPDSAASEKTQPGGQLNS